MTVCADGDADGPPKGRLSPMNRRVGASSR